jgi:hypothetical protein
MITMPAVIAPKGSIRPSGRLTMTPIWIQCRPRPAESLLGCAG